MKTRHTARLLATALLSLWLVSGCADKGAKSSTSSASPEAMAAIAGANDAIAAAKKNDWIWRDTEGFAKKAKEAADKGDSATAIKLATKAKFEAESAVSQFNHETANPRGL